MTDNECTTCTAEAMPGDENDTGEWLNCLPWDGEEKSLPSGGQIRVPGLAPEKLVRAWHVLDAQDDEGFREVDKLQPEDLVIGARINEAAVAKLMSAYGPRAIVIRPPGGGEMITREEWRGRYGTDGLALWAMRNARMRSKGPFVVGGR